MNATANQTRFSEHLGSPLRANAGAGTGKTTAIVMRVQALIEAAIPPRSILLMTFSRKGAEEMKNRVRRKVGVAGEDIVVGTFHSIAAQELRRLAKPGERPMILDENDADDFWTQAYAEVLCPTPEVFKANMNSFRAEQGKKELKKGDPDKQWAAILRDLSSNLRDLRSEQINQNKADQDFALYSKERLLEAVSMARKAQEWFDLTGWINQGLANYERIKLEQRSLDYDDALARWADLLRSNPEYRERTQNRWQHVLVDEYQDTNYLQEEIIKNLNVENLTVVGDPAQCIYAFRSAVPKLMIEFHQRYQGVAEVALKENFRSKDEIIAVANAVLLKHDDMIRKNHQENPMARLQLKGVRGTGGNVRFIRAADTNEEMLIVFQDIKKLLNEGVSKTEIIVLARNSFYFASLEGLLRSEKIPVQIWGGHSLMESQTMKDLIALMKIALRPSQPQNFKRVAKHIIGGERTHDEMFLRWKMGLTPITTTQEFIELIDQLCQLREAERKDPKTSCVRVIAKLSYDYLKKLYAPDGKMPFKRGKEFEAIQMTMKELIEKISAEKEMEGNGEKPQLEDLITQLSLDPTVESGDGECLTLSTIHQAKGLEWPHVFIVGCHEAKNSFFRNGEETTDTEAEEECRLLYVAITRARNDLTMTFTGQPIRFLETCPVKVKDSPGAKEGWKKWGQKKAETKEKPADRGADYDYNTKFVIEGDE